MAIFKVLHFKILMRCWLIHFHESVIKNDFWLNGHKECETIEECVLMTQINLNTYKFVITWSLLFPCEILGQASHQTNETLLNRGVLRSALSKIA